MMPPAMAVRDREKPRQRQNPAPKTGTPATVGPRRRPSEKVREEPPPPTRSQTHTEIMAADRAEINRPGHLLACLRLKAPCLSRKETGHAAPTSPYRRSASPE